MDRETLTSGEFHFEKKRRTPRQFCEECENKRVSVYGTWKNIRNFVGASGTKAGDKIESGWRRRRPSKTGMHEAHMNDDLLGLFAKVKTIIY